MSLKPPNPLFAFTLTPNFYCKWRSNNLSWNHKSVKSIQISPCIVQLGVRVTNIWVIWLTMNDIDWYIALWGLFKIGSITRVSALLHNAPNPSLCDVARAGYSTKQESYSPTQVLVLQKDIGAIGLMRNATWLVRIIFHQTNLLCLRMSPLCLSAGMLSLKFYRHKWLLPGFQRQATASLLSNRFRQPYWW